LKYEIERLESTLADLQLDGQSSTHLPELSEVLKKEKERIKLAWREEVFSTSNESTVELYIQRHQVAIIDLKDQILKLLDSVEAEELLKPSEITDRTTAFKALYQTLHSLLSFIEKYFTKYFDLSAKVPNNYWNITARNFSEKLPVLKEKLKQKALTEEMIWSVTSCFGEFIENKEAKVSYRRVIYLKELCRELNILCELEFKGQELEEQVCASMVYINFNSLKLFNHYAKTIKESFQRKETLNEQLEVLAHYSKKINQVQEKPGFSYKPSYKTIKSQLSDWVTEEIIFLERKQQLSFGFKVEQSEVRIQGKTFKIQTDSSVAQVAYFTRILVDTGLIKNKNTVELIRFFAAHVSSKRVQNIAQESFRRKFYEVEDSVKQSVKEDLIKMLNQIKKVQ
jgi:hypothetical protein